ncbi:MAG TPA: DUF4267 domain-containing protein [Hyphomicrobiaceae bacterium]|nr:DUF4267 domain-containing protein [Hyphomicrobiaceae bacterium]
MSAARARKTTLFLVAAGFVVGTLLGVIGLRYFLVPQSAARSFGVAGRPAGHELYYIIGLRNLWLATLAIGLAALRQWHGLALWFAAGTVVCFADALIAANATGKVPQVAFHLVCGLGCALLATIAWRRAGKGP